MAQAAKVAPAPAPAKVASSPVMAGTKTRHFKWDMSEDGTSITLNLVATGAKLAFAVGDIAPALHKKVLQYGLKQLLSDRTADIADTAEKVEGMKDTFADLAAGTWSERKPSERSAAVTKLQAAIARVRNLPITRIQEVFATKKDALTDNAYKAWVAELKGSSDVMAAMAAIAAEEAAAAAQSAKETAPKADLADF